MARKKTVETLGQRVRRLRLERGISQRELARGMDHVSYAYVSRLEAGSRIASIRAIRAIAFELGVNPVYLETGQIDVCPHCGSEGKFDEGLE